MQTQGVHASESYRTRLVGFSDLQGRETLQVALQGDWCYVGHHPGNRINPLTGKSEDNGTSILDVSEPKNPTIVAHIPGAPGANCRAVQVVKNYRDGNDYLIRNHETATAWDFQVFNITDRSNPVFVSSVAETPAGPLTFAHKGWWDESTGLYFGSAGEPGFRPGGHLVIWDLSNPSQPKYVSNHWLPGQKLTEPDPGGTGLSLHHPVVDMANKKVYLSYPRGGNVAVLDISNISNPTTILDFTIEPPLNGPHTSMPFHGVRCPNFTPGFGDIRDFIVFVNEASDAGYLGQEVRKALFMLDVSAWNNPITVDTFKVPDGDFCQRGGRFGPHQFAETRDGKLYSLKDNKNLLYVAYFSAGLRILDLSDPYDMQEVGYYIPKTTATTVPRLKTVIQTNDVDIDYRGLAYITDRAGTGLHVIEYLGQ
ncbi:MAG: hypothetical protein HY525_05625 [Betaproteobacteria bacterium]|nr:hypothetical protein [Betaproteobacteria bacterium]